MVPPVSINKTRLVMKYSLLKIFTPIIPRKSVPDSIIQYARFCYRMVITDGFARRHKSHIYKSLKLQSPLVRGHAISELKSQFRHRTQIYHHL